MSEHLVNYIKLYPLSTESFWECAETATVKLLWKVIFDLEWRALLLIKYSSHTLMQLFNKRKNYLFTKKTYKLSAFLKSRYFLVKNPIFCRIKSYSGRKPYPLKINKTILFSLDTNTETLLCTRLSVQILYCQISPPLFRMMTKEMVASLWLVLKEAMMSCLGPEKGRGGGGRERPLTLVDVYDIAADIGKVISFLSSRAVDPDPHGSAFIFHPGSVSAFNLRIRIQERKV